MLARPPFDRLVAAVQKLGAAITDLEKLRCSEHTLYLWCHHQPRQQVSSSPPACAVRPRHPLHPLAPRPCIGRARGSALSVLAVQKTTGCWLGVCCDSTWAFTHAAVARSKKPRQLHACASGGDRGLSARARSRVAGGVGRCRGLLRVKRGMPQSKGTEFVSSSKAPVTTTCVA